MYECYVFVSFYHVDIAVRFTKNTIKTNPIMELCLGLINLGKCFELLYLIVVMLVETQFLLMTPRRVIYAPMKKSI